MASHVYQTTVRNGVREITGGSRTYTGTGHAEVDQETAVHEATTQFVVAFPYAAIKSIVMLCTQNVTVKTNSSMSPADEIDLEAGVEYAWNIDSLDACLITANVTSLYVVNASLVSGTFSLDVIYDATP